MNKNDRNKVFGAITDILICLFVIDLMLSGREIITEHIGTYIFMTLIALGLINGIIFGDTFSPIVNFWDKYTYQPTKGEEYLQETIDELKYGYGMSKQEVIEHLKRMYGLTDDEATILYNKW